MGSGMQSIFPTKSEIFLDFQRHREKESVVRKDTEVWRDDMSSRRKDFVPEEDSAWMQITLFVVPKSIPAMLILPLNPNFAMMANPNTTIPTADGRNASMPPRLEFTAFGLLETCLFFCDE